MEIDRDRATFALCNALKPLTRLEMPHRWMKCCYTERWIVSQLGHFRCFLITAILWFPMERWAESTRGAKQQKFLEFQEVTAGHDLSSTISWRYLTGSHHVVSTFAYTSDLIQRSLWRSMVGAAGQRYASNQDICVKRNQRKQILSYYLIIITICNILSCYFHIILSWSFTAKTFSRGRKAKPGRREAAHRISSPGLSGLWWPAGDQ